MCQLPGRSVPRLRLVCSELCEIVDEHQDTIGLRISKRHHARLRPLADKITSFRWPLDVGPNAHDVVTHFLAGLDFWCDRRGRCMDVTPSRNSAMTWMLHLYLSKLRAEGRTVQSITRAELRLVVEWAFVMHQTTWLGLYRHHDMVQHEPPNTLDSCSNFIKFIEDFLKRPFRDLDLPKVYDEIFMRRSSDFSGTMFEGRKGGVKTVPGDRLLTTFNYTLGINSEDAVTQFTMRGLLTPETARDTYGLPILGEPTRLFGYQLQGESIDARWATHFIRSQESSSPRQYITALQVAAVLEYVEIY